MGAWLAGDESYHGDEFRVRVQGEHPFDMSEDWGGILRDYENPITVNSRGLPGVYLGAAGDDFLAVAADQDDYSFTVILGSLGEDWYSFTRTSPLAYYMLDFRQMAVPMEFNADGINDTGGILGPQINHTITGIAGAMWADGVGILASSGDDVFNVSLANGQHVLLAGFEGNDVFNLTLGSLATLEFNYWITAPPSFGVQIDLRSGEVLNDGFGSRDQINYLTDSDTGVEISAAFLSDHIIGSHRHESFLLYSGDDTVDAGGGRDRLLFRFGTYENLVVDLAAGTAAGTWNGSPLNYTLSNFEIVAGSSADDELYGGPLDDFLEGSFGDDLIVGREGDDRLFGDEGNDTIRGGLGADLIEGGPGDDLIDTGGALAYAESDGVDPGPGNDTVMVGAGTPGYTYITNRFIPDPVTVWVDGMSDTVQIDKGASGTTTVLGAVAAMNEGFLGIFGTAMDDTFHVTAAPGGTVVLNGGRGNDFFDLAPSDGLVDLFFRGTEASEQAPGGIRIDLAAGRVLDDGTCGQDVISGVGVVRLQINATRHADSLLGSAFDDRFVPRGGNDSVDRRGGTDLVLYDRLAQDGGVLVNLEQGSATGSYLGEQFRHELTSIEHVCGGTDNDSLTGSTGAAEILEGGAGFDMLVGDGTGIFHTAHSAEVYRLYDSVFDREPGVNGHQGWLARLSSGEQTLQHVAAAFVASPEFQRTYGNTTDAAFVTLLYMNVLNRAPTTEDLDYWVDRLSTDLTRERVLLLFSEGPEHRAKTAVALHDFEDTRDITTWADDVYRLYRTIFDREPEPGGFEGWVRALASGSTSLPDVIENFMNSPEFQATYSDTTNDAFVTLLYNNVLKRNPDPGGLAGWVEALDNGMERATLVRFFMESPEFVSNMEPDFLAYIAARGADDVLDAGADGGLVAGGLYMDTFIFSSDGEASTVTVTDLEAWDTLSFRGFGATKQQIFDALVQQGRDVVLSLDGEMVVFANTELSEITLEMIDVA
ncbi:hypothetical protein CDZ98_15475 [Mameliella alba]|nr:hypothetical protein CDZ98_15475 [Mameliella alba]